MLKNSYQSELIEAGVDEAGRGALVGHVFAAAVILPKDFVSIDIKDSKLLSIKQREILRTLIEERAVAASVAYATIEEIDNINIEKASFLAMHRAISKLTVRAQFLTIDGSRFQKYKNINHLCVVKGDNKYLSIAAASILAKTYRDDYMNELHKSYPIYCWDANKGYPTKQHREIIAKYGITPFHRTSFKTNFSKFAV